jgi:predicted GTPase
MCERMKRILIVGAGDRDFHNFNVVFRNSPEYQVVAFTATQILDIANRRYPPVLADDSQYPDGISIFEERDLDKLIATHTVLTSSH